MAISSIRLYVTTVDRHRLCVLRAAQWIRRSPFTGLGLQPVPALRLAFALLVDHYSGPYRRLISPWSARLVYWTGSELSKIGFTPECCYDRQPGPGKRLDRLSILCRPRQAYAKSVLTNPDNRIGSLGLRARTLQSGPDAFSQALGRMASVALSRNEVAKLCEGAQAQTYGLTTRSSSSTSACAESSVAGSTDVDASSGVVLHIVMVGASAKAIARGFASESCT